MKEATSTSAHCPPLAGESSDIQTSFEEFSVKIRVHWKYTAPDLKFVKKFTRPNFRTREFYTLKMHKLQHFLPAIRQRNGINISDMVLFWLKLNKMCKFLNSYEESLHKVCVNLQNM